MRFKPQFARVPYSLIDSGVIGVIGARCFAVYVTMLRFAWRGTHDDDRVTDLQRDGKLVAWVSQGTAARLLGVARQTVNKDVAVLIKHGLVEEVCLSHNRRAYILGSRLDDDGKKSARC